MSDKEVSYGIEQFRKALLKLKEAIVQAVDELDRDGVIQRFEFTFERAWKALKVYLEYVGKRCSTPRECLKEAFRIGLIDQEKIFLNMLEDRNLSSHTYDERTALQIFEHIKESYQPALQKLLELLEKKT